MAIVCTDKDDIPRKTGDSEEALMRHARMFDLEQQRLKVRENPKYFEEMYMQKPVWTDPNDD